MIDVRPGRWSTTLGTTLGKLRRGLTSRGRDAGAPIVAAPGAYIPTTGATSFEAEMANPAGAYGVAGASALVTAGIPVAEATTAAAETVSPPDAYAPPGASAPIVDMGGAYRATDASGPATDRAGAYSSPYASDAPFLVGRNRTPTNTVLSSNSATAVANSRATSREASLADEFFAGYGGAYSGAGASALTTDPAYRGRDGSAPALAAAGTYIPIVAATSSGAERVNPAGASAPTRDPAGVHSGAAASAPTLGAPSPDISVTEAASPAKKIVAPPGTYLPPGATAPIADPGGTYTSGYDASAPTADPAGTYSSPYALTRLFIEWQNNTPDNTVLPFSSVTAVENYYGVTSSEATLAKDFFAVNYGDTSATMLFTRLPVRRRPHLLGANVSDLTLSELQSIKGSLTITFQGWTYSGTVNLSAPDQEGEPCPNFTYAAGYITDALNRNLPVAAVTAESSIAPVKVKFTGSTDRAFLTVTSVTSGSIEIGTQISGPGIELGTQIISQVSGTPGGVGVYNLFAAGGNVSSETITETYGVLTAGAVNSGTVGLGEQVTGAGVLPLTAIDSHLSGSGAGSTWVVNNAQTVAGENMTMTAPPLLVYLNWNDQPIIGATENNNSFNVSVNGAFGYDLDPSSLSYMSGTAATALGLTLADGAINSSPGGQAPSMAEFMNSLVQNETSQWGSFQSNTPKVDQNLEAWAQPTGYQFLTAFSATPPAGSSMPMTDPAGTYSPAGASAPTPATPPDSIEPSISEKGFDTAIDSVNASTAIQDEAETYEARVWASDALSKYVAPFAPFRQGIYGQGLQFWVESPTLQINVQVEPTPSTLPPGLTQSESVFLQDINSIEPDTLVANAAYIDTQQAYAGSLGLGATAAASGNTIWAYVYGPETTTIMMVHPT